MRRIREFKPGDDLKVERSIRLLKMARTLLVQAKCPKASARVSLAISSALGASRNMGARKMYHDYPSLKP